MKKIFKTILIVVFSLALLCTSLVGCGGTKWTGNGLVDSGSATSVGGFIAETDKYYYFINGVGVSSDNNTLGVPQKGALYAADKTDLSKINVVIPKLFVSSDYTAGVYIYNDYAYYGTPSTYTSSSGSIASNEMLFMRTKLDGTNTQELFNAGSLSTKYRITAVGNDVYIVYYDMANASLKAYNVTTKSFTTIADKSIKNKEVLDSFLFVENKDINSAVVIYTAKVYEDEYDETLDNALGSSYARVESDFNRVYVYSAGDEVDETHKDTLGTKILDGEGNIPLKHTLNLIKGKYLFYSTNDGQKDLYYARNFTTENAVNIVNYSYVADTSLIDVKEVSGVISATAFAFEDEMIKEINLTSDALVSQKVLANIPTVSKLLFVHGDYIYYISSTNEIYRIKIYNVRETVEGSVTQEMVDKDTNPQLVSQDKVSTSWYAPQVIENATLGNYVFYCDNSSTGASYVKGISLDSEVKARDTDKNDINDEWYLDGEHILLGKMTDAAVAQVMDAKISDVKNSFDDGKIVFDTTLEDGSLTMQLILDVKEEYDNLTVAQKNLVSTTNVKTLNGYIEAIRIYNIIAPLEGFENVNYYALSEGEKQDYRTLYNNAKTALEKLKKSTTYDYQEITKLFMDNGCGYSYQCAGLIFESEE